METNPYTAYRQYLPEKGSWEARGLDVSDRFKYSKKIVTSEIFQPLWNKWNADLNAPFYGVTTDGKKREGLYSLRDEGAPTRAMVDAAKAVLGALSPEEKSKALRDLDSNECRQWSNPELILFITGVRLEDLEENQVQPIMELLRQSLSESGYKKVRDALKINEFLGQMCECVPILNERSYSLTIFGEPSETEPWGYLFYGHHVCLHVSVVGNQMAIGPVFVGAEPCIIDEGPAKGTQICIPEGDLSLELMQSLSPELQKKAQTYRTMQDPAMPEGRWNPADQRHLGGAFQDNRVIPYKGILASRMTSSQQETLMSIVKCFVGLLPPKPLEARLAEIRDWLPETYFSWIGGYGPSDPFYFRIQSPVVLLEFDHHSGVFLTNQEPAKHHIHTIQRLPNGNDYGMELRRLARARK